MGSSKRETPQDRVDRMLQMAGIPNPEEKSACMRAALAKGYYNFTGELAQLETVVWQVSHHGVGRRRCAACRAVPCGHDSDDEPPPSTTRQGKCLHCQKPGQKATLRQLLDQPDDGLDYAQGAPGAVSRRRLTPCVVVGFGTSQMDQNNATTVPPSVQCVNQVVSCAECRGSFYLTHLCTGRPERDTGKVNE